MIGELDIEIRKQLHILCLKKQSRHFVHVPLSFDPCRKMGNISAKRMAPNTRIGIPIHIYKRIHIHLCVFLHTRA